MVRRKTESIRAGRAAKTDDRGSGEAVDWYARAPSDQEFDQRRSQLEANGVDVHTSYWQAGDWFGVGVEPLGQFATNAPDWGGKWHVTMGVTTHADHRRLRAFRVHWECCECISIGSRRTVWRTCATMTPFGMTPTSRKCTSMIGMSDRRISPCELEPCYNLEPNVAT